MERGAGGGAQSGRTPAARGRAGRPPRARRGRRPSAPAPPRRPPAGRIAFADPPSLWEDSGTAETNTPPRHEARRGGPGGGGGGGGRKVVEPRRRGDGTAGLREPQA